MDREKHEKPCIDTKTDYEFALMKDHPLILQRIQKCSLHVEEETTRDVAYLRPLLVMIRIVMFGVFPKLLTRF